jgi:hypothetical protein
MPLLCMTLAAIRSDMLEMDALKDNVIMLWYFRNSCWHVITE